MFFDYGYKGTTFFLISNFFLTFFILFSSSAILHIYAGCPVFPSVPVVFRVRWCAGRVSGGVLTIICTRIHTRAHVRARGFLDRNF